MGAALLAGVFAMKRFFLLIGCLLALAACTPVPAATRVVSVPVNQFDLELRGFDEEDVSHLVKSLRYYDRMSLSLIFMNTERSNYRYVVTTQLGSQALIDRAYKALEGVDLTTGNLDAVFQGNKIILKRLHF
jgi:hypothetical protein